ncbi:MAG: ACT domain-containing protein [Spirochaetia bacterium]|nr:ACT domain-containing protein [Spirochaetia bacterium]
MKDRYLLLAGGVDQKGIVYNLTAMLKKYGFNIEDSSMIMLRRTFSVIMLLSAGAKGADKKLAEELKAFAAEYAMSAELKKITEKEMKEYDNEGSTWMISVSGADRPGIVSEVTQYLYKQGANVIDLETKSSEDVKPHAYYMFLEVDLPKKADPKKLEAGLKKITDRLGVHVSMNEVEKAIL